MNFFKSVFAADLEPSVPSDPPRDREEEDKQEAQQQEEEEEEEENEVAEQGGGGGGGGAWNFGGFIKTIASRSESVIQTYRRDLEEFSTGLKKETTVLKEVATRAVRDLPGSLEVGVSVAQESLESVGQAIDEFGGSVWRGTTEIISHGKEALLNMDSDSSSPGLESNPQVNSSSSKRYSRFEVQVLAIQNDPNTFVEKVEDGEDFEKWRSGFELQEMEEEIEGLLYENGNLEGIYEKFVPDVVDRETFWSRYFYRVYKLKQAEDARAKLVKRAISGDEEEELSWEVDDDDEETKVAIKEVEEERKEEGENAIEKEIVETSESNEEKLPVEEETKEEIVETLEKPEEKEEEEEVKKEVVENSQAENVEVEEKVKSSRDDDSTVKRDDKTLLEPKSENGESSKDSDFSVISTQPSMQEEEDLEWDEIEDLGEHEDKKVGGASGSPKQVDLRKRLSVTEDDEDLSWDIEDDE